MPGSFHLRGRAFFVPKGGQAVNKPERILTSNRYGRAKIRHADSIPKMLGGRLQDGRLVLLVYSRATNPKWLRRRAGYKVTIAISKEPVPEERFQNTFDLSLNQLRILEQSGLIDCAHEFVGFECIKCGLSARALAQQRYACRKHPT